MCTRRTRAFTLVELLICLAIAAILLGLVGPSLSQLLRRNEATSAINWLVGNVVFARHAAVTNGTMVTLCPSRDGKQCGGKWHEGTIAFTDIDADRKLDADDRLLRRFEFPLEDGTIKWRAFQNRQYLQMTSRGYTNYQNGNFVYCPGDGDIRYARQLVINIQGRARTSKDVNGDGYVEDRYGKHLRC